MARRLITSRRAFALTLALTLIASLLPGTALGFSNFLAEIFGIVMTPFADLGNRIGAGLRPPPAREGSNATDSELIRHLQDEMVEFERLYRAEQARVEALERQLEQIQKVPIEYMKTTVQPISARVTLRSPTSALGTVTVSRGSNHGVKPGTIAVYNGVELLGRIIKVDGVQSTILPLANRATGWIKGAVLPGGRTETVMSRAPKISLEPKGDGTFIAQADKALIINPGDEVVLLDESWPASAQAMKIGAVESVRPNDMEPLRNTVIVRPAYQVSQLASIVLKLEVDNGQVDGGRKQP